MTAEPVPGARRQAGRTASRVEPDEPAVEAVFSPAEPVLNPGAAKAVLDLLLRAYEERQAPSSRDG